MRLMHKVKLPRYLTWFIYSVQKKGNLFLVPL